MSKHIRYTVIVWYDVLVMGQQDDVVPRDYNTTERRDDIDLRYGSEHRWLIFPGASQSLLLVFVDGN